MHQIWARRIVSSFSIVSPLSSGSSTSRSRTRRGRKLTEGQSSHSLFKSFSYCEIICNDYIIGFLFSRQQYRRECNVYNWSLTLNCIYEIIYSNICRDFYFHSPGGGPHNTPPKSQDGIIFCILEWSKFQLKYLLSKIFVIYTVSSR